MERFKYTVLDQRGLHARNALSLCKLAESLESSVILYANGKKADCRNMMALMNLRVCENDIVEFCVEGAEEEANAGILKATIPTML